MWHESRAQSPARCAGSSGVHLSHLHPATAPLPCCPKFSPLLHTHTHANAQQYAHLQNRQAHAVYMCKYNTYCNHTAIQEPKPDLFFFLKSSLKHADFSKTAPVFKPRWDLEEGKNHPTSASKNVKLKAVPGLAVFSRRHYTLALFVLILVECCSLKSLVF